MFSRSFENNMDKTQSTTNLSLNDQSKHNEENMLNLFSKSSDITTDVDYHNASTDFLNDHKYYKVINNY